MPKEIEIIPAIMPHSFGDLREGVERVVGLVDIVQIDVMDGVFVSKKNWPYNDLNDPLRDFVNGSEELPFSREIRYEIDLMVSDPDREAIRWMCAGASRIVFHVESVSPDEVSALIEHVRNNGTWDVEGSDARYVSNVELGVALNIETDNKSIEGIVTKADFIQCMGIARIGYQGEPFDDRVISKIARLRELYPDVTISVDGGVNFDSAPKLVAAGANRLVSGSAVWESPNIEGAISRLKNS